MTRKRLIVRGTLISIAIVVAYAAGWFLVANILKSGIADWVAERLAERKA